MKQSPTSEKAALRRAVEGAKVTDSPTRLQEALKLAETLIQNNKAAEIHLFSDGATAAFSEFENKNLPLTFHKYGQRGENVGIVNLDVRSNPREPGATSDFLDHSEFLHQCAADPTGIVLEDKVLEVKTLNLKGKETAPQVFIASQEKDGVFGVRISGQDDLPVDNKASIVSLLPQPVKVLLVTSGNRFLEKALKAVPTVELTKATAILRAGR